MVHPKSARSEQSTRVRDSERIRPSPSTSSRAEHGAPIQQQDAPFQQQSRADQFSPVRLSTPHRSPSQEQQDATEETRRQTSSPDVRWSPNSRQHVVAAIAARSRAARGPPSSRLTSLATRPSDAAFQDSYLSPTAADHNNGENYEFPEYADVHMDKDDDEDDHDYDNNEDDVEDHVEYDLEDDAEGDEEHVDFVTSTATIKALASKFRSEAWKEYVPLIVNGRISKGKCKHCHTKISAKRGAGTSALLKHLHRCKKRSIALKIVQSLNSTLRSPDGRRLKKWNFDPEVSRRELARMIALHGLPFICVEYDGFRRVVASPNPMFKMISRTTASIDCMRAFKEQKLAQQEIFKDSKCRFSLAADMWTSNQALTPAWGEVTTMTPVC